MPDVHDLLATGAGAPIAPLDLDRAVRRGQQRTRNRRLLQGSVGTGVVVAGAAVALTLAGGSPRAAQQLPGSGQTQLLPDDSVPGGDGSAFQPVPAADPSQLPDGINFVLVRQVLPGRLVLDKVTRTTSVTKQAKCAQSGLADYTPAQVFSFCWSNQNAKLRTVPVADGVRVLVPNQDRVDTEVIAVVVRHNTVVSMTAAEDV